MKHSQFEVESLSGQALTSRVLKWLLEQLGSAAVNEFLTMLAVERNVAPNTQNQALSSILFLYRDVLDQEIAIEAVRAKKPKRLPVVLSISLLKS